MPGQQTFPQLSRKCNFSDAATWSRWAISPTAERDFPPHINRDTTPFQRLLLVQTLRPDRLVSAMQAFATEALGVQTITPNPVSLSAVAEEVCECVCLVFALPLPRSASADGMTKSVSVSAPV